MNHPSNMSRRRFSLFALLAAVGAGAKAGLSLPSALSSHIWQRISLISDEYSDDLASVLTFLSVADVRSIELRALFSEEAGRLRQVIDLSDAELAELRLALYDVNVPVVNTPIFKCEAPDSAAAVAKVTAKIERALFIAASLRAPNVRMFSFFQTSDADRLAGSEQALSIASDVRRRFIDQYGYAPRLLVENEAKTQIATTTDLIAFLERWPLLDGLWDPGNAAKVGEIPLEGLRLLKASPVWSRIRHVQIKDLDQGGEWVPIGQGVIPYGAIIAELDSGGYFSHPDHHLGLETHCRLNNSRADATLLSIANLKDMIKGSSLYSCQQSWMARQPGRLRLR